ncbi:glycoside hydrolase family 19 protein [Bosea sp. Tri-44]|uniref:glycoside hydrolase family 19 protein n=1 Tax=Bosea sp. Tri-44 TaxID=1972137 RepID=UPI0013E90857|nr:glycoside hydrolase family 19 protein [Bosea sp. Tri-44]
MSMQGSSAEEAPVEKPQAPRVPDLAVTVTRLARLAPMGKAEIMNNIALHFDRLAAEADLTTPLRVCHFLAQAAHESDRFRTLEEKGGKKQFARYEGRTDLGNTEPGDGARYHGRGIFQLTGRANYKRIGRMLNVDLEGRPELALDPRISVQIAFAYWRDRKINAAADRDDTARVTQLINGGANGLADRRQLLTTAKGIWF